MHQTHIHALRDTISLQRLFILTAFILASLLLFPSITDAASQNCVKPNVRWASSSNRVYVSGSGTVCTLSDLDALIPAAPITLVDPANKTWFVGANIQMENGGKLELHGSEVGGDVDELRLKSDSGIVAIKADWGSISIDSTKITSWDSTTNAPDTNYGNQRAFINVRSKLAPDGVTALESRMDITNSEIGYLGFNGAESYGLSWKVIGTQAGLFDKVNVLGDVTNSTIHHNYFGAYTYGAYGMQWLNNTIYSNVVYGLDPHDNSDLLTIQNNDVHHNGTHGIICSRFCDHLTITSNKSYNNGGNGIMMHRLADDSLIEDNDVYNNGDAGIAIFDSHNNMIRNNRSYNNDSGIRFSVGSSKNTVYGNTFRDNRTYGMYFYKGSDAPTNPGDGRPKSNTFEKNLVTRNAGYGIKLKESDSNTFRDNQFITNGKALLVEVSHSNRFELNTIKGNTDSGLSLSGSTKNVITSNIIDSNKNNGVLLKSASNNTTITNNTIRNHKYGIYITSSTNAIINNNTFENNGTNIKS